MRPASWWDVFVFDLLVDFHILSIIEHQVKDDAMNFFDKKVRTIMVDLHNTDHYPFVLGLIQFDLSDSIQKKLNVSPFTSIDLFAQQKGKISDIFLTIEL